MNIVITGFLKFGLIASAILLSSDLVITWYLRQKNRLSQLNEVCFVMSNERYCCTHTTNIEKIKKCTNPHCKGKLFKKIIEHIDSANHIICIAMYMFTMSHIGEAILKAKKRGIIVRIVSDFSMLGASNSQINKLQEKGIPVRVSGNENLYMHNKFCLIDVLTNETKFKENKHPLNGVLINGSLNWTTNGFDRNWENVSFTSDNYLKTEYKKAFDHIWAKCK